MDKMEMAKQALTGMSLTELLVVAFCSVGLVVMLIGIVVWINKQQMARINALLEPLKDVPLILATLTAKVKSGEQLEKMMDEKIKYHSANCPLLNRKKGG